MRFRNSKVVCVVVILTEGGGKYDDQKQQDAQEFVADLIEGLHLELNEAGDQSPVSKTVETNDPNEWKEKYQEWLKAYYNKQCRSPVADLFYGHLIDVSTCDNCRRARFSFDYFATLPLDLTRKRQQQDPYDQYPLSNTWTPNKESFSMRSLTEDFFAKELIPDFKCEGCKKAGFMSKQQLLLKAPRCLLVFLKRFKQSGKDVVKLDEKVRLDDVLEVGGSQMKSDHSFCYRPVSLVEHFGSLSAGHYTCKSLQKNGTWVAISDDRTVQTDVQSLKKPGSSSMYLCALEILG